MAGPSSVTVNNNASMYDAFKALTNDRAENRGTIEIVAKGDVKELKCAQHHFYSGSTIRPNADLNGALADAIKEGIDRVANKLILGIYENDVNGDASGKADRFVAFMKQVQEKLTSKLYVREGGEPSPVPMTREAIREIVTCVEDLKKYTADELQRIDIDVLCDPKILSATAKERVAHFTEIKEMGVATFVRTLNDDKLCQKAAKMDFALANCGVGSVDGRPVAPCTSNPFSSVSGTTLAVIDKVMKGDPQAKTCTQVCADARHYACGILAGWHTQEESVVADMDPMVSAHIKGRGFIRPEIFKRQYRYAYTQGENRLSTSSGYMIKGKLGNAQTDFLFSSVPALGAVWTGMDSVGNTDYFCAARKQALGRNVTEGEREKARTCFEHLCDLRNGGKLEDLTRGQFKETMLLLMFGDCDVLGEDADKVATRAIETVKNGSYDKAKVMKGYEDAIRQSVRGWIDTARNRGATHFVGTAIGCGVFMNDPEIIAKITAEEFVSRAGDMKFVYANYKHDPNSETFQAAFQKAFAEISKTA